MCRKLRQYTIFFTSNPCRNLSRRTPTTKLHARFQRLEFTCSFPPPSPPPTAPLSLSRSLARSVSLSLCLSVSLTLTISRPPIKPLRQSRPPPPPVPPCEERLGTNPPRAGTYRGTSLTRNSFPFGTYSNIFLEPYGGPKGGGGFL